MVNLNPVCALFPSARLLALALICAGTVALLGCGIRVPPAQQPQLISSGLQVSGSSGSTTTLGTLDPYCNDYTIASGPNGRGFYITIEMPTLNHPEVTFAGRLGEFWGAWTDPAEQSLSQGPRPITQQQVQNLQGDYVGYFIHDDFLTGNDYHVVLGILLGRGVPETGIVQIRSTNTDPQNTGLQARSNPLEIPITGPVRVTSSLSSASVQETQSLTISWIAENADAVEITGPGVTGATGLPVSGSRTLTAVCTGDRDSTTVTYRIKAFRNACPTPRSNTDNLSATITSSRAVTQFDIVPLRPLEGTSMTLRWNAPGATSVTLTGPNSFTHNANTAQGQTSTTAPSVAQCLSLQNFTYGLTANWPSCGVRTDSTLASVVTNTQTFDLVESGGTQCLSSHVCRIAARSLAEARACARCPIQQGCSWR